MFFEFVPTSVYTLVFHWVVLILVGQTIYQASTGGIYTLPVIRWNNVLGCAFVLLLIAYMGLRPVDPVFGDTVNYAGEFFSLQAREGVNWLAPLEAMQGEWLFAMIMHGCVQYGDVSDFFLICSIVYVGALALASYRIFGSEWFVPFLTTCAMYTFWVYGVNGVRNGMAASVLILALSFRSNIKVMLLLAFLGMALHKSMFLLIAAGGIAWFVTDVRMYLAGWLLCIGAVMVSGPAIGEMLASSGLIEDPRMSLYILSADELKASEDIFSARGFRWDFLIYSSFPIITGCYFIFKENFQDVFYTWLLNIYIMANAFWVLCMYAAFSNRFAQLSWFLMGLVFIYPFFKHRFWADQEKKLAYFLPAIYIFSFYMNIIKG